MEEINSEVVALVLAYRARLQKIVLHDPRLYPVIESIRRLTGLNGIGLQDYELILSSEDGEPETEQETTIKPLESPDDSEVALTAILASQLVEISEEDEECIRITDEMLYVHGVRTITINHIPLFFTEEHPEPETSPPDGTDSFRRMMAALGMTDPEET